MSTFSISAILSATDKGFSSTIKNAIKSTDTLGSKLTSGFNFGVLTGMGQQAFAKLSAGVSGLVGEINQSAASWKTFESNMKMLGKGDEIEKTKKELQSFAEETIYSSSDMASTFAQMAAVGVEDTAELVKSFGGLAAAAENPQQAMKTLSQQATQMAAKPKVMWQDFKLMLEQTPAGIAAVAKEMGMSTSELVTAVQDGEVSTKRFFNAMKKAAGTGTALNKMATQYKTAGQAAAGLQETLANKLTPAFNVVSQLSIDWISTLVDKISGIDGEALAGKVQGVVDTILEFWDILDTKMDGVGTEIGAAFKSVGEALGGLNGEFTKTDAIINFRKACAWLRDTILAVTDFIQAHADTIAKLIPIIGKLAGAFLAIKAINSIPILGSLSRGLLTLGKLGIGALAKGIGGLATKGIGALASKIPFLSKFGQTASVAGEASVQSGANMLKSAQSFALMGVAVLTIAAGIALLAFSAISLANAGGPAIAVMAGLVIALVGLGAGMAFLLNFLAPMSAQLMPAATAMLVLGAAVVVVAVGLAILAGVAILLANSGGLAIGVMVGLVAVVALLAVGAAALAPALVAGAAGFTAFGAALLMVAAAALVAAVAVVIISTALPTLAQYGLQGALAIAALGAAMIVFAAGAAVAGVALVVMAAGIVAFGISAVAAAVGVAAFGIAMTASAVGVAAMALGLKAVNSTMKTISKNAKATAKSLKSMQKSVKTVESGLSALGSKAKSAMSKVTSAFDNTASKAQSAGQKVGTGFTLGMQGGLASAPVVAVTMVNMALVALSAGYARAYGAGAYIGIGFANGMLSQLGVIQAAANKMAAAADKAVRAKAKIKSPSRVSMALGEYWGEGYVEGIGNMINDAWKMTEQLVSIPQVATPAMAYSGELSSEYDYYRNTEYVVEVPVVIDGKTVAKTTAPFMENELNKKQIRDSRKHGKV